MVAVAVSLLWNFPLQRYFVFRHGQRPTRVAAPAPAPQDRT